jgi:hypothetical protein
MLGFGRIPLYRAVLAQQTLGSPHDRRDSEPVAAARCCLFTSSCWSILVQRAAAFTARAWKIGGKLMERLG